jgi:hypothetical protein
MSALPNNQISPTATRRGLGAVPGLWHGQAGLTRRHAGLRLRVYLTRGRLDRSIAAGHGCEGSEELVLRARQLTDPSNQRKLARNLRRVIDYADKRRPGAAISAVVIDAPSVRRGRWAVAELAEQLERAGAATPRGIVLAQALLSDGVSPLFNRYAERTVASAVRDIREALDGDPLAAVSAA